MRILEANILIAHLHQESSVKIQSTGSSPSDIRFKGFKETRSKIMKTVVFLTGKMQ